MLRSQSCSRASPSGGNPLDPRHHALDAIAPIHPDEPLVDRPEHQLFFTAPAMRIDVRILLTRNQKARGSSSAAMMSSATSFALRFVNCPNPSRKTELSSSGAMNGIPFSLPSCWSSAPQPGAMCTSPVPSASLISFHAMTRCASAALFPPPVSPYGKTPPGVFCARRSSNGP